MKHKCQNGISTHKARACHADAVKGSDFCAVHLPKATCCAVRFCAWSLPGEHLCADHAAEFKRSVWRGDLKGWLAMRTNERVLLLEAK